MFGRFIPDEMLPTFDALRPEALCVKGIDTLLLDIDNTLAPYEEAEPNGHVRAWLSAMKAAGIRCAFLSNNHEDRVALFNETLGLPYFAKAGKPGRRRMRHMMARLGADPAHTAMMGDQIFTDVWAGKRVGLYTILVPPIKDKTDLFTRGKRWLERPILRAARRRLIKAGKAPISDKQSTDREDMHSTFEEKTGGST